MREVLHNRFSQKNKKDNFFDFPRKFNPTTTFKVLQIFMGSVMVLLFTCKQISLLMSDHVQSGFIHEKR